MSVRGFQHVLFRLAMIGDIIETSKHRNDMTGSWYAGEYLQHAARITDYRWALEIDKITIATAL
jgi:hypothetical protein